MRTQNTVEICLEDTVRDALRPKIAGKTLTFGRSSASRTEPHAQKELRPLEESLSGLMAKAIADHPAMDDVREKAIADISHIAGDANDAQVAAAQVIKAGQADRGIKAEPPALLRNGQPFFGETHKRHWPAVSALAQDLKDYARAAGKSGSAKYPPVERLGLRDGHGQGLIAVTGTASLKPARQDHVAASAARRRIDSNLDRFAPPGPAFDGLRQHIVDTVWERHDALAGWNKIEAQNAAERQKIEARTLQPAPFLSNRMHYPMAEAWQAINQRQHLENQRLKPPSAGFTPEDALEARSLLGRHAALCQPDGTQGIGPESLKLATAGLQRLAAGRQDAHAAAKTGIARSMDVIMPAKPGNHAARTQFALSVYEHRHAIGNLTVADGRVDGRILPPNLTLAMKDRAGSMASLAGSLEKLSAALEGRPPQERAAAGMADNAPANRPPDTAAKAKAIAPRKRPLEGQSTIDSFFKRPAPEKAAENRGLDTREDERGRSR